MNHVVYDNFVLENKIEDLLITAVDMNAYLTPDYSLTESAGMTKKVHTYTAAGDVQDLGMGEGNSEEITVSFVETEYKVGVTQGNFNYFDEQAMTDPNLVDAGLKGLSQQMTNDLTNKAIAELNKATIVKSGCTWVFDDIVDAIAMYPHESEEGLFLLINKAEKASFRKNLKNELSYVEDFVRAGYIGHICGVPVIVSDAVPAGTAFLASKAAVKCLIKKGVEIEQERDANIRKNKVFARKVMVVALVDATRVVKLTKA